MTKQKQYIDRTALLRQAETLFDGQREVMGVKAEHIYSAPVEDVAPGAVQCEQYTNGRNDGIKEFAEKLKEKAYPFPCAIGVEYAVAIRAINDLVKELTENQT